MRDSDPNTASASIVEILRGHAKGKAADRAFTFLIHGEEEGPTLTFGELDRQALILGAWLQRNALPGQRAALIYSPGLEFITSFFGCLYAGIVPVLAHPPEISRLKETLPDFQKVLADAAPSIVLSSNELPAFLGEEMESFLSSKNMRLVAWHDILQREPVTDWKAPEIRGQDPACLFYTSGSTGTPKGIIISHANLLQSVKAAQWFAEDSSKDRMLTWLPLYHNFGLFGTVLHPVYTGIATWVMPPMAFLQRPMRWLEAITKFGATASYAPNFAYDLCSQVATPEDKKKLDLGTWARAGSGGEKVSIETMKRFESVFMSCGFRPNVFQPGYGLGECTSIVTGKRRLEAPKVLTVSRKELENGRSHEGELNPDENSLQRIVSCGTVPPGHTILIVDPETLTKCAPGTIGEIWVSGPTVGQGYWNKPLETEEVFRAFLPGTQEGPFLRTGDLGFLKDEYLFVTGRRKDLIIIRGKNFYPQDLEDTAGTAHPKLSSNRCAAFAEEKEGLEHLVIVAEMDQEDTSSSTGPAQIIEAVRESIARKHGIQPGCVLLLPMGSLPRTSTNKIRRRACREEFSAGNFKAIAGWCSKDTDQARPPRVAFPHRATEIPKKTADFYAPKEVSAKRADALIAWLRGYAAERINSRLIDERRSVPPYIILDFGNQGLLGMQVFEKYGGLALRNQDVMRVMEQLGAIDLTLATLVGLNNVNGILTIQRHATESIREKLLPALAKGRELAAFGLTEPEAGSHLGAIRSTAVPTPRGSWKLSGVKRWNGSGWAGVISVFAQLLDSSGHQQGLTGFVVRQGMSGLRMGPEALTMGYRGIIQNSVILDDVEVEPDHLLGELSKGINVFQDILALSRTGVGAVSLGGMKRCAQLMYRFATRRYVSTGRLLENPVTLAMFTNLGAAIKASESLISFLEEILDEKGTLPPEIPMMAKVITSEFLCKAADDLVQLLGGRGFMENNMAPQMLRDARVFRIGEGANETLNMYVGRSVVHSEDVFHFLRDSFGAVKLSERLREDVDRIKARYTGSQSGFSSTSDGLYWTYAMAGNLANGTLLNAALEREWRHNPTSWVRRSLEWAQLSYQAALQRALAGSPADSILLSPKEIAELMTSYNDSIADIEQACPGEDLEIDPLLRRVSISEQDREIRSGERVKSLAPEEIETWLVNWLIKELNLSDDEIDKQKSLFHYGIDSLRATRIAYEMENWLGRRISPAEALAHPSIQLLARHLATSDSERVEPLKKSLNAEQELSKLNQLSDDEVDFLLEEISKEETGQ